MPNDAISKLRWKIVGAQIAPEQRSFSKIDLEDITLNPVGGKGSDLILPAKRLRYGRGRSVRAGHRSRFLQESLALSPMFKTEPVRRLRGAQSLIGVLRNYHYAVHKAFSPSMSMQVVRVI
ncbi:hypothetical protein [Mesorhizobium sp. AA23]|uniref:hypothetical protein n=1 Tax=Mesorhizobium sp. AA23 TaxID=1854058 RepID=UPI0012E9BC56|nr:hypothetical protein [Mesorhizobium sp. AA23]